MHFMDLCANVSSRPSKTTCDDRLNPIHCSQAEFMARTKTLRRRTKPCRSTTQLKALPIHSELAKRHEQALLLKNIKEQLPELEKLLAAAEDHWGIEDGVYRFYHQSFKVYGLQSLTLEIAKTLQKLLPGHQLNDWFTQIVVAGTREKFTPDHNRDWTKHTRPIVEAFFHAHFMLKMVCKYGRELSEPPQMLPSGWAAVLHLFNLR